MSGFARRFSTRRQSTYSKAESSNGHSRTPTSSSSDTLVASVSKTLDKWKEIIEADAPIVFDRQTFSAVVDFIRHKDSMDDRKMFLERLLMLLAKTPTDSDLSKLMTDGVVQLLYNDLTHPPATYVSNTYAWRMPDGSFNNVHVPDMGRAGMPYARSVQQQHPLPGHMLPDPELVFDTLLKREKFEPHPAGLSSLMFAWAALVIHTCFRTNHTNWTINDTSSYVDLSPLYGANKTELDSVRLRGKDGRLTGYGLLKKDTFAEDRLLLLPPAVSALLVLFNRNHNYIAGKILSINERGTWYDPKSFPTVPGVDRAAAIEQQDEEIFNTARLINCGWFAGIVFSDYFSAILGFVRLGITWSLLPFEEIRMPDHSFFERGQGNAVSVEFNCLYRWHATTSQPDEEWIKKVFAKFFAKAGLKPGDKVDPGTFAKAADAFDKEEKAEGPENWTFSTLVRTADGSFQNEDLARVIMDATAAPAARFGARGTPEIMRTNEVMGIDQSRRWGVCSLNDFRKFLGLKPYGSFLDWNSNPEIAEAASKLYYGDINNLELYVGLQAEETKELEDGTGLCPGYTVTRAILADAIALTRGDRFYTTDMTPHNYTAWGLKDCTRDANGPGFGSMLGRLLLRTLPDQFTSDSTYTWFPLMTPEKMSEFTGKLKVRDKYNFDRPGAAPPTVVVDDYTVVKSVLGDRATFRPPYADRVGAVVKGQGFFIAYDQTDTGLADQKAVLDLLVSESSLNHVVERFTKAAKFVIERDSYFLSGNTTKFIDISAVLKAIPIFWVCNEIAGIPLKTENDPDAKWSEADLYSKIGEIYQFIFLENDPAKEMTNEDKARSATEEILSAIKSNLKESGAGGLSFSMFSSFFSTRKKNQTQTAFMEKLVATGKPIDELANSILSVLVGATLELSQAMINMVNLYLEDSHSTERQTIQTADSKLLPGYAREAMRLDPPFAGVYREARAATTVGSLTTTGNERLFLSIAKANKNSSIFPNPEKIDPTRAEELYLTGDGISRSFGNVFVHRVMGEVLKTIFSLKNLRRAPGMSGKLKRFPYNINGTDYYQYLDTSMDTTPWATALILQYDV